MSFCSPKTFDFYFYSVWKNSSLPLSIFPRLQLCNYHLCFFASMAAMSSWWPNIFQFYLYFLWRISLSFPFHLCNYHLCFSASNLESNTPTMIFAVMIIVWQDFRHIHRHRHWGFRLHGQHRRTIMIDDWFIVWNCCSKVQLVLSLNLSLQTLHQWKSDEWYSVEPFISLIGWNIKCINQQM